MSGILERKNKALHYDHQPLPIRLRLRRCTNKQQKTQSVVFTDYCVFLELNKTPQQYLVLLGRLNRSAKPVFESETEFLGQPGLSQG